MYDHQTNSPSRFNKSDILIYKFKQICHKLPFFKDPLFITIVLKILIKKHTHICFVFESEVTAWSSTMKMSRSLSVKSTHRCPTILCGAESLETFLYNGRILPVIVGVHLYIRCTDVNFVTALLLNNHTNIA